MAGITAYKSELVAAVLRGDLRLATKIVLDFCSRIKEFADAMPPGWLDPYYAEEISVRDHGFHIKMDGKYLHCRRECERWCVSESDTDTPHPSDTHLFFAQYAGAPFPFFEGVKFALECMENVANKKNDSVFVSIERKRAEAHRKYEDELSKWSRIHAESEKLKARNERMARNLRAPKNAAASQAAVSPPVSGLRDMVAELPSPPTQTVSVSCAAENMIGVSGIYFIWREGQIVYVGRSRCVASRLKSHHVAEPSDHVSVVAMPNSETYIAELVYIAAFRPRLNSQVRDSIQEKKKRRKSEPAQC